jgi:hypothetical protein
MGNGLVRLLRRSAPPVMSVAVLAVLTAGCSLVEMPSNRVLAEQPQTTGSSTPAARPTASRTAAAPPQLDVTQAERQSANARTMTASFRERVIGPTRVTITGQVQVQRSPLRIAEQLTLTTSGQSVQLSVIVTGKAIYVESLSAPGVWIRVPLPRVFRTTLVPELRNADPTAQARLILAAGQSRLVGRQSVDGAETTRYAVSVAPEVALGLLPSKLRALLAPLASLIDGDIHYVLWIGTDGQLKQYRVAERTFNARITLTETIDSFDQPVDIAIPQATAAPSLGGGVLATA